MEMKPRIIAHRGYSQKFPENTLQAFEAALRAGAEVLETDLQISHDGVVILRHDYLSPCGRPLCELTWSEIKKNFRKC